MKTRYSVFAVAGAAFFFAGSAMAQSGGEQPSNYVQLNLGSGVGGRTELQGSISGVGSASDHVNLKPGFLGSAAVGHSFGNGVALEAEALYFQNGLDTDAADKFLGFAVDGSSKTTGVLVNATYHFPKVDAFYPYVGLGAGYGKTTYKAFGVSGSENGAMWQARLGVSYPWSPTLTWDLGYRYVQSPQPSEHFSFVDSGVTYTGALKLRTDVHAVTIGGRVKF